MAPTGTTRNSSNDKLLVILLVLSTASFTMATQRSKVWIQVYRELNDGADPEWTTHAQAENWAIRESQRLQPVVISILRGERENIRWTAGLALARVIATADVVAELQRIMTTTVRGMERVQREPVDEMGFLNVIDILSQHSSPQFVGDVRALLRHDGQSRPVVEHCVSALRRVGEREDLELLRQIPLRRENAEVDKLAILAERFIAERAGGRDPLGNANVELRAITRAWVAAVEAKDRDAYMNVLPLDARAGLDKHDFDAELLGSPELPRILAALKGIAGREAFEIDHDKLEATMIVGERYKFLYVLEVDGWRIHGPLQIAP